MITQERERVLRASDEDLDYCYELMRGADENYPREATYYDKIRNLAPKDRDILVTLYCFLRVADDILDDAEREVPARLSAFRSYHDQFRRFIEEPADVSTNQVHLRVWRSVLAATQRAGLFECVDRLDRLICIQEEGLRFRRVDASYESLYFYNYALMSTIADIFLPLVFPPQHFVADDVRVAALRFSIINLLLAMQLINLVVDVDEDMRSGQAFFHLEELTLSESGRWELRPQAKQRYLALGQSHICTAEPAFTSSLINAGMRSFLTGLRDIYDLLHAFMESATLK